MWQGETGGGIIRASVVDEEGRFAPPAQHDVELVLLAVGRSARLPGDQGSPGSKVLDPVQDRVDVIQRLFGKVELRDKTLQQSGREDGEMNVRGAHPVVVARVGIRAGLDRAETVASVRISQHASPALEVRVERRIRDVIRMFVLAPVVRLPDFYQRLAHRLAILIEDAPGDCDRLALRRRSLRVAAPDFVLAAADEAQREERADRLRRGQDADRAVRGARLVDPVALDPLQALLAEEYRRMRMRFAGHSPSWP